jgi:putative ABC transport system permease protein
MEALVTATLAPWRFCAALLGAFSMLGLLLAAIGLFGAMSQRVAERTREIAIRIALGAEPAVVLKKVVTEGMRAGFMGVAVGTAASIPATRLLSSYLYGVKPTDLAVFVTGGALLLAVILLSVYRPARRAANVDPLVALRHE